MTAPPPAHALRVKNLPGALSADAVDALLRHHGAAHVKLLRAGARRVPQGAVATFASRVARDAACAQLNARMLAGYRVRAEPIEEASQPPPLPPGLPPPPLPPGLPPPPPVRPPVTPNPLVVVSNAPAPLAPHLGLHFAPSPLLEYKYPKASEAVVRNIANALMALPKFYTQVLHLMNKMNLPPPFEANAIPGVFSSDRETKQQQLSLKRKYPGAQPSSLTVEEEEDDDDDDVDGIVNQADQRSMTPITSDLPKKQRVDTALPAKANVAAETAPHAHQESAQRHISVVTTALHPSKPKTLSTRIARAFEASALGADRSRAVRPGVISEQELERLRRPASELAQCPFMRDYKRGVVSHTLRVRNLAETADEQDLRFLFGCVLPLSLELSVLKIEISDADKSATVVFPSAALATAALDKIHGVSFEGLPLVVSYNSDLDVKADVELEDATRSSIFSVAELDARRLEPSVLVSEKFMRNYQRGEPSATLYVKNLAKDVVVQDLVAVFGAVLPDDMNLSEMQIRHFTEGRMKCQAFVAFPTAELATSALDASHGVVLKGKPLIVCFRKPPAPAVVAATTTTSTTESAQLS